MINHIRVNVFLFNLSAFPPSPKVFKLLFHAVIGIHGVKHRAHDTFLIQCLSLPFFLSIKLSLTLSIGMAFITFSHNSFFIIQVSLMKSDLRSVEVCSLCSFFRTRVLLTFISFDVILHWKVKSSLWGIFRRHFLLKCRY